MEEYEFEIIQDGVAVATACSTERDDALREIMHYAAQYAQDGAVLIRESIRNIPAGDSDDDDS